MKGFLGYSGFGDDASTWSNPYAANPATTSAPPMVDASSASGATAGSVLTSGVGLVGGLVNIFGQGQQNALAQQNALLLAQQQAVSPGLIIVVALGGLLGVGFLLHSMHHSKPSRRTAGYKRRRK